MNLGLPLQRMMQQIRETILQWFKANGRELPWRSTHDPYSIWLSEVILQQTRIDQGLPYYLRFVERFPVVEELAKAEESEVLRLWQGLGYYNRARNLHFTAQTIVQQYNGKFPEDFHELKKLKGIGDYTASAIASMAFNKPHAVVDGNVNRVLSRIFGIREATNSTQGQKLFKQKAQELLDETNPGTFNEAMMDFGAVQCLPANPHCIICPLQSWCHAYHHNAIHELPFKEKKVKKRTRHFHYLVIESRKGIWLQMRGDNDIWRNLYDLPLIETKENVYLDADQLDQELGINELPEFLGEYRHTLTHQNIVARFYQIEPKEEMPNLKNHQFSYWEDLNKYPFPRLIEKFFQQKFQIVFNNV